MESQKWIRKVVKQATLCFLLSLLFSYVSEPQTDGCWLVCSETDDWFCVALSLLSTALSPTPLIAPTWPLFSIVCPLSPVWSRSIQATGHCCVNGDPHCAPRTLAAQHHNSAIAATVEALRLFFFMYFCVFCCFWSLILQNSSIHG